MPSAAGKARAAAAKPAPPFTPKVQPKPTDPVTVAREAAAKSGKPVEVGGQTTETSILYAEPDGSLQRQMSAGPVRVQQNGTWMPIDTNLSIDKSTGTLKPAAVVGSRAISDGGSGPLATLGTAGTGGASVAFGWPTALPTPAVSGATATYRNVLDGVDLVVTATSVGFTEHLVVTKPLTDPAELSSIALAVTSQNATATTGAHGSLVLTGTTGASKGKVLASAGAPQMWDAKGGHPADGAGADRRQVGARLTTSSGSAGTLVLSPDLSFLTDPATVYPVTIDPAPSLSELGDTYITTLTPDDPQSGGSSLFVGDPDSSERDVALLRFDASPVAGYTVLDGSLALWNSYSTTCDSDQTSVYRVDDFDPATVTWNTAPAQHEWVGGSSTSLGFNAGCPAGYLHFDATSAVQYAVSNGSAVALLVHADSDGPDGYKVFNSGNAAANVPTLTVTYASNCDLIDGYNVCDEIRDKYQATGGDTGPLGQPTMNTSGIGGGHVGSYEYFQNGVIYWSPSTGAHILSGAIEDKYENINDVDSFLGLPTGDQASLDGGTGASQDFEHGSIYWSTTTNAYALAANYVAYYRSIGAQASYLGYPSTDSYDSGSGGYAWFNNGVLAWDRQSNTIQDYNSDLGWAGLPGWATDLDYRLTDTIDAKVDVGTGNLNLSVSGLTVPGIGGDRTVGLTYNSFAAGDPYLDGTSPLVGNSFRLTDVPDVHMEAQPDGSVGYVDPSGREMLYRWNGSAYLPPVGEGGTTLTRDGSNNWVLTTLASNRKQTFDSSTGREISDADRNGNTYTFAYDGNGVPTSITGTRGGAPITFTTGGTGVPSGMLASMQQTFDGATRKISFGYDTTSKLLTSITDATGKTTTFGWTGNLLTSITDPRGIVTAFQFNDTDRVLQVVRDYGHQNLTTALAWDVDDRNGLDMAVTRVTDPNSGVTAYGVDQFGKVTDVTDPLGHNKATTYSPNNDVATAVDAMPAADTMHYSYNGADGGFTPTGVTLPTGASATASYPTSGTGPQRYEPTSSTDAQGNSASYGYDAQGNQISQATGGVTVSSTVNPPAPASAVCGGKPGQTCTSTDGRGNTTHYSYDSDGDITTITPPPGVIKATSYTYDGNGRPKTMTDGNGQVTTYVYDKDDRVTQIRYHGATGCSTASNCEVYSYDGDGNLTQRVDAAGTTTYTYNSRNLLSTETTPAASGGGAQTSTLTYDAVGNLTSYHDQNGTTSYGYDAGNNLTSLAEPGGSCTGTVSKCTTYSYNANDVRTAITYPGGTTVDYLNIDASNRPTEYKATTATGSVLMDLTYSFAGTKGDTALVQSRNDATVPGTAVQTYTYDAFNRLTRALEKVGGSTTVSWSYCYDANGNRIYDSTSTAATVLCPGDNGGPAATYSYDATNALTGRTGQPGSAFSYDGNGAELAAVGVTIRTNETWNAQDQLTALTSNGNSHSYSYAGEGNKERVTADSSGFQNTALGVTTQTGTGANHIIREPNGTPVALVSSGTSYYYIADRQGSTIALVDTNGTVKNTYSYDPYGASRTKTETVTNPYQYIGGQLDSATGLYHLDARYYDPSLGRFNQPDPSGEEANPYAYTACDPVSFSDPTGRSWSAFHIAKCAGVVILAVATAAVPIGKAYKALKIAREAEYTLKELWQVFTAGEKLAAAGRALKSLAADFLGITAIQAAC